MTLDQVNDILRNVSEQAAAERMSDYIEWLEEEEMRHYEHDMMMYASHSYDMDAIAYGMQ